VFSGSHPLLEKLRVYSNYAMVAVYMALGIMFFFTDVAVETFPSYRKEIGCTMMIYSVVRIILTYRKNKREKDEFAD
jgi:hypothetical protein